MLQFRVLITRLKFSLRSTCIADSLVLMNNFDIRQYITEVCSRMVMLAEASIPQQPRRYSLQLPHFPSLIHPPVPPPFPSSPSSGGAL